MIDPGVFSEIFAVHAGPLALYARQLDPADADELIQETFVRLMGLSAPPPEVRPWLVMTLRRLAIDRRRSWFRRRRREKAVSATPWFEPAYDDRLDGVRAAELLQALPQRQCEVVVLRIWNGLTLAQVARTLGISDSTAHTDLTTALTSLRQQLEETRCRTT